MFESGLEVGIWRVFEISSRELLFLRFHTEVVVSGAEKDDLFCLVLLLVRKCLGVQVEIF